jgi:hypothetical protein
MAATDPASTSSAPDPANRVGIGPVPGTSEDGTPVGGTSVVTDGSGAIRVTLCDEDYELARQAGALRVAESRRMKLPGRAGCPPSNLEQDINGAAAEIAFARAIGEAPSLSVNTFGAPDVAGYHVRSTHRPQGRLIVRPGDPAENLYVLVTGQGQQWRVIGTITGEEAMRAEYWYDRNGRPGC